jgi:hypothetical protein
VPDPSAGFTGADSRADLTRALRRTTGASLIQATEGEPYGLQKSWTSLGGSSTMTEQSGLIISQDDEPTITDDSKSPNLYTCCSTTKKFATSSIPLLRKLSYFEGFTPERKLS